MARPKKVGGFSVDLKKPAMSSDKWEIKGGDPEMDADADDEARRQGKYDLEKLLEAEEIKANPEKMKHAMAHAEEKMTRIRSIQDLKDLSEAKYGSGALVKKRNR